MGSVIVLPVGRSGIAKVVVGDGFALLDQLSTSQTSLREMLANADVSRHTLRETEAYIEEAELAQTARCENGAPFIFFVGSDGKARIVEGCCNDWTCGRCGIKRAKAEYGRMVNGAKVLSERGLPLYFVTLTCRGKELALADSEAGYKDWCNTLLTAMRTRCKRAGFEWFYGGVTERQQRGHPHSHLCVSWCPDDAIAYSKGALLPNGAIAKHEGLYSQWLVGAAVSAGLGPMVDISLVNSAVAVAVYQSKYMFKDAMRTVWPKGWKRVRYSNSWPKLPKHEHEVAFPLVKLADWKRMENLGLTVYADSQVTLEAAYARLVTCVVYKQKQGV
jgi:hypothetical protein